MSEGERHVDQQSATVLVVDDEIALRRVFERVLRSAHNVLTATGAAEARRLLDEGTQVAVIISDYRMPGDDGITLLREWATRSPDTVRILTSAYAELSELGEDVDACKLYTFLAKPFDSDGVRLITRRAVEHHMLTRRNRELVTELEQHLTIETTLRRTFQQYVPEEVVAQLTAAGDATKLEGRTHDVTLMLVDLRGFTAYTERREPHEVVALLNRFFAAMAAPIIDNGGAIDKYIGDAILAHFGGLHPDPEASRHALDAALAMRDALEMLNRELARDDTPALCFGVAINSGPCIVGNVGCNARMDYTVIGDAVNVVARMQELTKRKRNAILVSGATRQQLGEEFVVEPWPREQVRGREGLVEIFEVIARTKE